MLYGSIVPKLIYSTIKHNGINCRAGLEVTEDKEGKKNAKNLILC